MNYGIPYQGSKSKIIKELCGIFPNADHFYDLFGGGFSVSHFMVAHRSKHFKEFHFNEIRPGMPDFIKRCIDGFYSYERFKPEWISRERFFKDKENNLYIKLCWSFGNNGDGYLFGKEIEGYKRSLHQAVVFNEFDATARSVFGCDKFREGLSITDKRLVLGNRIGILHKDKTLGERETPQQLQQLEQLEQLQQLERLQQLEQLEQLHFHNTSYELVPIKPNSVIYCDIPYKGTGEYDDNKHFNRKQFFEWALAQTNPLFISEYDVEYAQFKLIKKLDTRSTISSKGATSATEKVYCNDAAYRVLIERKKARLSR